MKIPKFLLSALLFPAGTILSSDNPLDLKRLQNNTGNTTISMLVNREMFPNPDIQLGKSFPYKTPDGKKIPANCVLCIIINGAPFFVHSNNPDIPYDTDQTQLRFDDRTSMLRAIIPRRTR